jgi:hypothetical protein
MPGTAADKPADGAWSNGGTQSTHARFSTLTVLVIGDDRGHAERLTDARLSPAKPSAGP